MKKIAYGILTWDGGERRSNRYGSVILGNTDYNEGVAVKPFLDTGAVTQLQLTDKRVRLTARIVETRPSGHIGDLFLGITPSTPEVGEEIELGVGTLMLGSCTWDPSLKSIELHPDDEREELWIDPRILYRLHDQTVDLFAEETEDPCHEDPALEMSEGGVVGTGDGDGSFQTKGVEPEEISHLEPKIERLGDGMFMLSGPDLSKGARAKFVKK